MSHSGSEVWAGDNRGLLRSFSMQAGTLKLLSKFDVGHTALVTGIHRSLGSLYSCSSDGKVKVSRAELQSYQTNPAVERFWNILSVLQVHIPSAPPRTLCTLNYQGAVHGVSDLNHIFS